MSLVSNAGPILSFGRAGLFDLLHKVARKIHIPDAVYDEIVLAGVGKPAARQVATADWIVRTALSDRLFLTQLSTRLHLGEQEAIALAKELSMPLFIDERLGRQEAVRLGVKCFGSLRVLQTAKEKGLVETIKPPLDQMIAAGMHLDERLYESFLARNGEAGSTD